MMKETPDLLQGTLDMLILKTLQLGPMHGFGISVLIRQISKEVLQIEQACRTGYEFGYGGSGSAQLALAILLDFDVSYVKHYQAFKRAFIARGRGDAMVIREDEIPGWRDQQEAPAIAAWSRAIATR